MKRWIARDLWLAAIVALLVPASVEAQQTGSVTGVVTAADTRAPMQGVHVSIEGTNIGGPTNAQGRFNFLNVPAGARIVKVTMLGYATDQQTVTVAAGAAARADFEMKTSAIQGKEIVVTALGVQRQERSLTYAV